jgi:uncharacterized protein (DUF58 family)
VPERRPGSLGPGPIPEAILRGLDLTVRRRLDGLVPGDQRTPAVGVGTELAQIRAYRPGDDVRQIDWNATARTGEPQVRAHVAERSTTTWLVVDLSPSMAFGNRRPAQGRRRRGRRDRDRPARPRAAATGSGS